MIPDYNSKKCFFIAEVGQNHNGSLETALEYVRVFAGAGADAIKFQTRNNKYLFSEIAYAKPYESENAFGRSYGEHREALELDQSELRKIHAECRKLGVKFMSTPFDEPSLALLLDVGVDLIKIASFDLGNLPFLHRVSEAKIPVVISTGGGRQIHISESVKLLSKNSTELAILHCVSEYPCSFDRLSLDKISVLRELFPAHTIGLSDHFNGILSGPIAYMMGARVFEKHVTLNRSWKGTDHSFALEPEGFRKFVRDTLRVDKMLIEPANMTVGSEPVFQKLGKSVCAYVDIRKGECFSLENLSARIFETEIMPVRDVADLLGKCAVCDINAGEALTFEMIEQTLLEEAD